MNQLVEKVKDAGLDLGLNVEVKSIKNPRKEAEEHYYNAAHSGLIELGLELIISQKKLWLICLKQFYEIRIKLT